MMVSRRLMLCMSLLVSLLLHGAMLAMAPRIPISNLKMPSQRPVKAFRVDFYEEKKAPAPPPQQDNAARTIEKTEVSLVEELVNSVTDLPSPLDMAAPKPVDVPMLSERVASETIEREHYLEPDPASLQAMDTKLVEIAQENARQDIEIARRLASPSPERLIAPDELPVLRGPGDGEGEPIQFGAMPTVSLLAEPVQAPGTQAAEEGAAQETPQEEVVLEPLPEVLEQAALPEVRLAPVAESIRKENDYEFLDDLLDVSLETYKPAEVGKAFFRLRITPKPQGEIAVLPKDVTFVLDASNSIIQRKLDVTAKGTRDMIKMLRPEDRFNIVIFRDTPTSFQEVPVPATEENKAAAQQFLAKLESRGQTDVYNAMRPVITSPARPGIPGVVMLMSDGRPTAGVRDARSIINALSEEKAEGNSVFAYGGGNTVNRYLLDLLAHRNKGESRVVPEIEQIGKDLPVFFQQINDPLLVNVDVSLGQLDESGVFPRAVPDFYRNRGVTIYGEYDPKKDSEFVMRLKGIAGEKQKEVIFKQNLGKAAKGDAEIPRRWAFEKIYHLIDRVCKEGEKPELLAEIRSLSKQYNIRTSYDE